VKGEKDERGVLADAAHRLESGPRTKPGEDAACEKRARIAERAVAADQTGTEEVRGGRSSPATIAPGASIVR
jgi:hypothetical protein